jgi:hypothetical protein
VVDSRPVQCSISGSTLSLADLRWLVAACVSYSGDSRVEVVAGAGFDAHRGPDSITVHEPGGQHGGPAGDPAAR